MIKPDERAFFLTVGRRLNAPYNVLRDAGITPEHDDIKIYRQSIYIKQVVRVRDIIKEIGMNHKRAEYLLHKWSHKDYYDWGVSYDLGWLTEKGWQRYLELEQEEIATNFQPK